MIFNRTQNYQFSTRLTLDSTLLETIHETRLLGTIVSSDLTWHKNTQLLIQRGYQRMMILRNLYSFNVSQEDLVQIYCMYIRSVIEFNSSVWFSSITQEEKNDIERIQRVACKIILKENYSSYEQALVQLKLENLNDRRTMLATRFADKCSKNDQFSNLFPINPNPQHSRKKETYKVKFARTQKLYKSSIPAMQRLLNIKK